MICTSDIANVDAGMGLYWEVREILGFWDEISPFTVSFQANWVAFKYDYSIKVVDCFFKGDCFSINILLLVYVNYVVIHGLPNFSYRFC